MQVVTVLHQGTTHMQLFHESKLGSLKDTAVKLLMQMMNDMHPDSSNPVIAYKGLDNNQVIIRYQHEGDMIIIQTPFDNEVDNMITTLMKLTTSLVFGAQGIRDNLDFYVDAQFLNTLTMDDLKEMS